LARPGDSLLDGFKALVRKDPELAARWLESQPDEMTALLLSQDWSVAARPAQQWPQDSEVGEWFVWFVKAGRGYGKTRTGAETVVDRVRVLAPIVHEVRIGLVAPTFKGIRSVMIEGESGLAKVVPPSMRLNGSWEDTYNRTELELHLDGDHVIETYSSEKPGRLRGPQFHFMWFDEPAEFKDAHLGYSVEEDTTFDMAVLCCRLAPDPRILITGTPKNNRLVNALMDDPDVVITGGSSYENKHNLAPQVARRIFGRYEGTRLGRQELHAIVLEGTGTMFQKGWWNVVDRVEDVPGFRAFRWLRYYDLAATEPSDATPDPDYTAGALMGVHPVDRTYCLAHMVRYRKGPGERDDEIKGQARLDHIPLIYIEQEKAQAGKSTVAAIGRHLDGTGVRVKGDPVTGGKPKDEMTGREGRASEAKVMRAEIPAGIAQQGRFYVVGSGRWVDAFFDETEEFPNGTHFDQVDAVSGGCKVLGDLFEGKGATSTTLAGRTVADVVEEEAEKQRQKKRKRRRTGSAASIQIAR
jgi:predicted phage terminase large subunit-like protein